MALTLVVGTAMLGSGSAKAEPQRMIGLWQVEVTFRDGATRSLAFEARDSGKGSFRFFGPKQNQANPAEPLSGKWMQSGGNLVTFTGPVQFPLGNVGLERGTLALKGKVGADGAIAGEAAFFPAERNSTDPKAQPSKTGTFKATRGAGG